MFSHLKHYHFITNFHSNSKIHHSCNTTDIQEKHYCNIINVKVIEMLLILCFICPDTPKTTRKRYQDIYGIVTEY